MELSLWENIILAIMVLGIVFWLRPSKAALQRSKDAPKDWAGFLIPMAAVIGFVIFLISMV